MNQDHDPPIVKALLHFKETAETVMKLHLRNELMETLGINKDLFMDLIESLV